MNIIKIVMILIIAGTFNVLHAQDPDVLVSLNSPAYGVKIKNNFPGYNGSYARAFILSNQDASVDFIGFGAFGDVVNGVSTMTYGYIGTEQNSPMMSFLPNGNIGIGKINPASKLDIQGQFSSFSVGIGQQNITTSSRNFANFGSNNHGTVLISSNLYVNGDDHLKIAKSHPTMAGASILIPGNSQPNQGGIVFYTNQPASVIEDASFNGTMSMIIKNDGNIGIGTITPREKLSVNGKIRAHEIKVETANWPDYVFTKDYQLPSLAETEKHIQEKGHLPGIPSAVEVKANGIDLGDMNAKLLQKIEELTLHLIEQQKKNEKLEDLVRKIANKVNLH
jgi:hypothetical protein